jgi:hypothetical protein
MKEYGRKEPVVNPVSDGNQKNETKDSSRDKENDVDFQSSSRN